MDRDKWTCKVCGRDTETLAVHHLVYIKGREPWDYPDKAFITVCENCHGRIHIKWEETKTMTDPEMDKLFNDFCQIYDYGIYRIEQFYKYSL